MHKIDERRILVTGGAGFLGYHLALKLSEDLANHISLVDNLARGKRDDEMEALMGRPNVQMISGDLTDRKLYENLSTRYDEVYHLAAMIGVRNVIEHPDEAVRINAISTLYLLDWFVKGGGRKILFSSTSETYAWTQHFHKLAMPTPENVPLSLTDLDNPRASYAGSKIFGELAVRQYCATYAMPFTIMRYHNIYGPRMGNEHVIPELYCRALGGQNPLIVYSADHSRAFCYISDAVKATISAMREKRSCGETFNIGNGGEEITIKELAQRILKKSGIRADISPRMSANDIIARRCPDISKAEKLLGYRPRVPLDDGLDCTLSWYRNKFEMRGAIS